MPRDGTASIAVDGFAPLAQKGGNILNVAGSTPLAHLEADVALLSSYASKVMRVMPATSSGESFDVVRYQLRGDLIAALGLFERADITIALPMIWSQGFDNLSRVGIADSSAAETALGDLRLIPRMALVHPSAASGFGLAALLPVVLPTGSSRSFASDGAWRIEPRLAADFRLSADVHVALNLGYEFRPRRVVADYVSNDTVRLSLAGSAALGASGVRAFAVLASSIKTARNRDYADYEQSASIGTVPLEASVGARAAIGRGFDAIVAGGAGLTNGIGAPRFRVVAGVEYSFAFIRAQ